MGSIPELFIKFILIILHLAIVFIAAYIILFSKDIKVLVLQLVVQTSVFIALQVNNGCLLSKYEQFGGDFNATASGKKLFFLTSDICDADFEKMFVGIPLSLLILKIILISYPLIRDNNIDDLMKKYFKLG